MDKENTIESRDLTIYHLLNLQWVLKGTTINDLGGPGGNREKKISRGPSQGKKNFWRPLSGKKNFRQPHPEKKKIPGSLC